VISSLRFSSALRNCIGWLRSWTSAVAATRARRLGFVRALLDELELGDFATAEVADVDRRLAREWLARAAKASKGDRR
jgi:hypothetical protein